MPSTRNFIAPKTLARILLVEADVLVRYLLADILRGCAVAVVEAANAIDAKAVLIAGPPIDVLMSDAQLAGPESGFALAQWARRYRPEIEIVLTSSIANKAQAAAEFCARDPDRAAHADGASLGERIRGMLAERKRKMRPPPSTAPAPLIRRKRRTVDAS